MKIQKLLNVLVVIVLLTVTNSYAKENTYLSLDTKNCQQTLNIMEESKCATAPTVKLLGIRNAHITMLRVHDVGTKYGPQSDQIDVEVVIQVAEREGGFGFKLRNDSNGLARQGMLDLLRDAFNHGWLVNFDYDLDIGNDVRPPKKNGEIIRVWLTKSKKGLLKKIKSKQKAISKL